MPRPVDRGASYFAGLDGIRTLAVTLVILYHLGIEQMSGGLLGVAVFFTLSGFLITSILLHSWGRGRGLGLASFWVRRARRLLPGVILVIAAAMVAVVVTEPDQIGRRGSDALAGLLYVANWHTIIAGDSYFDATNGPGPFGHLWSLSIEEQFYLCWPVLLAVLLIVTRARLRITAAVTAALAAGSFFLLDHLAVIGDNTRAYEGTDTRAGGLLLGAAFAMLWQPHRRVTIERSRARSAIADVVGLVGIALIIGLSMMTGQNSLSLYRWGLLTLSVATVALIYAACVPSTLCSRVLGCAPMRWVGERSYGIYLWHLPVITMTPQGFLPDTPWPRAGVQVALTVLLAAASWRYVEDPIRSRGFRAAFRPLERWRPRPALAAAVFTPVAALALIAPTYVRTPAPLADTTPPPLRTHPAATPSATPQPTTHTGPLRTKCTSVIHLGDSTSAGLISPNYLPNPADREGAQLKAVGVQTFIPEIAGARSLVERVGNVPNGVEVVKRHLAQGYDGCWVIAMGTNDSANQVVGGDVPEAQRIARVMDLLKDKPVMWLTVRTLKTEGPYAETHQQTWNQALVDACADYPNMRIYDWASEVQNQWYVRDGIHFTTPGYRQRSHRIARSLAISFPADGPMSPDILVSSQ